MRFNNERCQKDFHPSLSHGTDECQEIIKIFWICEWHKNLMSNDIRTMLGILRVLNAKRYFILYLP